MGAGGVTNHGTIQTNERNLTKKGKPNSKVQRYKNGKLVQERWYDKDGNAERNRDYEHQDAHKNHTFPHDHAWINGVRSKEINPNYDKYN